jgi:hypothetical protein
MLISWCKKTWRRKRKKYRPVVFCCFCCCYRCSCCQRHNTDQTFVRGQKKNRKKNFENKSMLWYPFCFVYLTFYGSFLVLLRRSIFFFVHRKICVKIYSTTMTGSIVFLLFKSALWAKASSTKQTLLRKKYFKHRVF